MPNPTAATSQQGGDKDPLTGAKLVFAWLWVGVPLAYGVWQVAVKSLVLFQ